MNDQKEMSPDTHGTSRRDFVRKSVYVAPAILSLAAAPAYAKAGSEKPEKPDKPEKPPKP